ncbi:MAG: T9SS type A sorting domain-containing protein [Bacteroidetes bacterium]|nr:T9SS type A sorting domain-containing protein [Bacteroidota bacterium]
MRKPFLYLFAVLSLILSNNFVLAQADDEENEETSETIFQREQYIYERRAGGPGKIISPDAYHNAIVQMQQMKRTSEIPDAPYGTATWQSVTPTGMFYQVTNANYVSGRTNSIAFHPTNANIMYIATAGGGVWKTTNGGVNWTVMTDGLSNIAGGDIAIDPNNPNVLYFGTGELNYSLDSHYGDGIFKSTDAGLTWAQVAPYSLNSNYSKIIVTPSNSNIVYAAGKNGVFRSINAGANWSQLSSAGNVNSLIMDYTNNQIMYFTNSANTGAGAVRKSTDGGTTWVNLTNGLPTGGLGRSPMVMSTTDHLTLYLGFASSSSGSLLGVYKTTDGGSNWTLQNNSTNYMGTQGWYDNAMAIKPGTTDFIVTGGLDLYNSTNSGTTLTKRTNWSTGTTSNFCHADIHYLTYNPLNNYLYCCSDGGIYQSTNDGASWTDLNTTISTLQYQSADYDPVNPSLMQGGCQDNNKQTSTNNGLVWVQRTTGDGGYTVIDAENSQYVYGQYVNGSIQRSANSGASFSDITPTGSAGGLFYNPYEMASGNSQFIVFGRADVWVTSNARTASSGSGWTQIATTTTVSGSVSGIGIGNGTNPTKIYIGTSNGRILSTSNGGTNWTTYTGLPYISDFAVDKTNDDICYVSCAGTSQSQKVFKTTNGGVTWVNISGNLPNAAVNTIILRNAAPRAIFVGTDLGVYMSYNDGATWSLHNTGMPTVEIFDLKYREGNKILLAATHGRGCFKLDLTTFTGISNNNITAESFGLSQNYPNPFNPTTKIRYSIPSSAFVTLKVYDILGHEVETIVSQNQGRGVYDVQWDASKYSSGVYIYKINAGSFNESKSMLLVK